LKLAKIGVKYPLTLNLKVEVFDSLIDQHEQMKLAAVEIMTEMAS
jgi:hypothetical protein